MFDRVFLLIQVSNQLSPKIKVVDLIVLYNFYFDQISCSNIKFGALDGQSRLKITQFWSLCSAAADDVGGAAPTTTTAA